MGGGGVSGIGYAILKYYGGVAMIQIKQGLRDSAKRGCLSQINSGIYNSVKYGLKGMRHKNANMYVARGRK